MNEVWTTRDGTEIEVAMMSDQHVRNTERFLRRLVDDLDYQAGSAFSFASGFSPDSMASYYAGHVLDDATADLANARNWARVFEAELRRRKLKPLAEDEKA